MHWRFPHGITSDELGAKQRFIQEIIDSELDFEKLQNVNFSWVGNIPKRKKLININKCKKCNYCYTSLLKHLERDKIFQCHQAYSEQEMKDLKDGLKLVHNRAKI